MGQSPYLIVFDDDMEPLARIRRAESFQFVENWYYPNTFELRIDREKPGADQIALKGHIGWVDDYTNEIRIGIIEQIEQPRSRNSEQWTITGRGSLALLDRRNAMNLFSDGTYGGYDKQSGVAYETAMRHFVEKNAIDCSDTSRNITGLSLCATDYLRGGTCEKQVRGETMLDILQDMMLKSTMSCDVVWTGRDATPGNRYTWQFMTYWGNTFSNTVKLSMSFSNVLSYKYLESLLQYRNLIYVLGTGSGATRNYKKVFSGTEPVGKERFETVVEATDCSTDAQLTARGEEILATSIIQQSLEFEYNPESQSFILGRDFGIGDIITVNDPDVATLVDRVISITTTYDAGTGKKVDIGMGTQPLDLLSIERARRKQVAGARA